MQCNRIFPDKAADAIPSLPTTRPIGPFQIQTIHHVAAHMTTDKPESLFFSERQSSDRYLPPWRPAYSLKLRQRFCHSACQPHCPVFRNDYAMRAPIDWPVRIIAPRLCGSSIPSRINTKGSSPFFPGCRQNIFHRTRYRLPQLR